jgi:hypothetical protein
MYNSLSYRHISFLSQWYLGGVCHMGRGSGEGFRRGVNENTMSLKKSENWASPQKV